MALDMKLGINHQWYPSIPKNCCNSFIVYGGGTQLEANSLSRKGLIQPCSTRKPRYWSCFWSSQHLEEFTVRCTVAHEILRVFSWVGFPLHTYHPQTSGLVKSFNQTLKSIMRKFVGDKPKHWHTLSITYKKQNQNWHCNIKGLLEQECLNELPLKELNDIARRASLGRAIQSQGAMTEKALLQILTSQALANTGTWRTASPSNLQGLEKIWSEKQSARYQVPRPYQMLSVKASTLNWGKENNG